METDLVWKYSTVLLQIDAYRTQQFLKDML